MRMWPFKYRDTSRWLKRSIIGYFMASIIMIALTAFIYFAAEKPSNFPSQSIPSLILPHTALILSLAHLVGLGLMVVLIRKCHNCRLGPAQRIATALKKMSNGDLGWKLTLRRGDELADVADSVTHASESLADRITSLQHQTRQLLEIENYLIDSVGAERLSSPYTIKALRKLKICTSRLSHHMEDFHVSSIAAPKAVGPEAAVELEEELQKT